MTTTQTPTITTLLRAARVLGGTSDLRPDADDDDRMRAAAELLCAGRDAADAARLLGLSATDDGYIHAGRAWLCGENTGEWVDVPEDVSLCDWLAATAEQAAWGSVGSSSGVHDDEDEPETVVWTYACSIEAACPDGQVRDLEESASAEDEPEVATECDDGGEHDWRKPYDLVGGIRENPGCWGSGHGSVSHQYVCVRCGLGRVIDHGATDRSNGSQCTRTTYQPGYRDRDELRAAGYGEEDA